MPQKLKEERAHIVLSHALFGVMTKSIGDRLSKEEYFQLLRKYKEEMLDAYLTESDYFPELLHYCNIIYETLPYIFRAKYNLLTDRATLK